MRKILLGSCYATGGVETMRNFVCKMLNEEGFSVEVAYPAPYMLYPRLSVPFWKIGQQVPSVQKKINTNEWLIGTWFPELEFRKTEASKRWSDLIHKFDKHIVVSGFALPAYPFIQCNIHPLCWLATSYLDERINHIKKFNCIRRTVAYADRVHCERQEKAVLESCPVMALSNYTVHKLQSIAPSGNYSILHMPVEIPKNSEGKKNKKKTELTIGFVGRLDDPRKNLSLLLQSAALLKQKFNDFKLLLVGGSLSGNLIELAKSLNILNNLEIIKFVERKDLPKFYRQLDVFVIPSFQEGLCIAGLEALASGIPVVSTKCGGPADFIIDGKNGYLVNFNAHEMADSIAEIVKSPQIWKKMSKFSVDFIREEFSYEKCREIFWLNFKKNLELRKAA